MKSYTVVVDGQTSVQSAVDESAAIQAALVALGIDYAKHISVTPAAAEASRAVSGVATIDYTPSGSSVAAGEVLVVGGLVAVADDYIADGATGKLSVSGLVSITKKTSEAWTQGALIYWDAGNNRCTTLRTAAPAGIAALAAGAADTAGYLLLNAFPVTLPNVAGMSALTAFATDDELAILDKSDTTEGTAGTFKRVTVSLFDATYAAAKTKVWIPANLFQAAQGAPTAGLSPATVGMPAWIMATGNNEGVAAVLGIGDQVPSSWATFKVTIFWSPAGTNTGNVRWQAVATGFSLTDTLATVSFGTGVTTAAGGTADVVQSSVAEAALALPGEQFMALHIRRNGAAGTDTSTDGVNFLGVLLEKVT